MNKFQRRESRDIHRMITYYRIQFKLDADYKSMRRNMRKIARTLSKQNNRAHKEAIRSMDWENGSDVNAYIRHDLFNTICIAQSIEVKNE